MVVVHQWICRNEPYKLMERFFFQILTPFSNFWPEIKKNSKAKRGVNFNLIAIFCTSIDLSQQTL